MYHLRLKGGHYQMGVKRGLIFQKSNVSFPLHLDEFQLEHGKKSERILKEFFPEVCEEIKGVSDTIGVSYLILASWMLCMGCCIIIWKIIFPPRLEDAPLLLIPKAAASFMAEITICPHI